MSFATCRLIPLLMLLPVSLTAQASLDSVARRLRPGQAVRLHSQTGQRAEGRFTVYHPDQAVVQLAMRDSTIQFAMIDSLWVRRTGAKSGAIVGAAVLGVPSAIFWVWACNGLSEGNGCGAWGAVAGLTVAGAGVGALLGAAIGSTSSRWQLRYASPGVGLKVTPLPTQRLGVGISIRFAALSR